VPRAADNRAGLGYIGASVHGDVDGRGRLAVRLSRDGGDLVIHGGSQRWVEQRALPATWIRHKGCPRA
jgi:hypothetical protein